MTVTSTVRQGLLDGVPVGLELGLMLAVGVALGVALRVAVADGEGDAPIVIVFVDVSVQRPPSDWHWVDAGLLMVAVIVSVPVVEPLATSTVTETR
ncbi:MAG: hypothetical protein ABR614_10410, partial [Mycobacteriales bacterium]